MKNLKLIPLCFVMIMLALVSCEKDAPFKQQINQVASENLKKTCTIVFSEIETDNLTMSAFLSTLGPCPASILPLTVELVDINGNVMQTIQSGLGYVQLETNECQYYYIRVTTSTGLVFESSIHKLTFPGGC